MMKFFNTAGPVNRPQHYKVDPLHRWDLDEVLGLIAQEKYFILHAPRQTGKTSSLLALQEYLNSRGEYASVYVNFEGAQTARNQVEEGMHTMLGSLAEAVRSVSQYLVDYSPEYWKQVVREHSPHQMLEAFLGYLSQCLFLPLVLLIDEIDALVGDTLVSVLRQLRAGYNNRPTAFPASVILCGVRDIKDYRIHRSNHDIITGGSAFNIKSESLRLGNFSIEDIRNLYQQHTEETGQKFAEGTVELVWEYTSGQPWLVNALGYEVAFKMKENRDRSIEITPQLMLQAKERLIQSRQTHLDQLADKLSEERVRRVIKPLILGEYSKAEEDDKEYCIDLGLINRTREGIKIANRIYREVIPRELTKEHQDNFAARFQPVWVKDDGSLDSDKLLSMLQDFWRENSEIWASHINGYQEAAPQLVTQAFLQRVANGSGMIDREYGAGRGRTDLMVRWWYGEGEQRQTQKIVLELKTINRKQNYDTLLAKALEQTAAYAHTCGVAEAHILIFDRDETRGWREKVFTDHADYDGVRLKIWGM